MNAGINTHNILKTLETARQPMSISELIAGAPISRHKARHTLGKLLEAGRVTCTQQDRVNVYSVPIDVWQIRHLQTGGYSMRCPDCGKRHRLRRCYDRYVLHCPAADSWRVFTEKELT